ncbi:hydrolase CocE/NonD family protein [Jatrophihabitans fulvus]
MTRVRPLLLALAAVVVIAGAVLVIVRPADGDKGDAPAAGAVGSVARATITADDGTTLSAQVVRPRNRGKAPLVVMPASWGQPATQYESIAREFAATGYVVVAYAQRGFAGSQGDVDFMGERTQRDVTDVIDWALTSLPVDPSRIGAFGMSYGAGASLLAAARDKRIRAVAALSGWTDFAGSFDPAGTPGTRALAQLLGVKDARLDDRLTALRTAVRTKPRTVGATLRAMSPTRSAIDVVDDLNRNKPAVLLANGFQDSIFPPGQLVTFFDRLTTPKRLQLAPGDHGGPEGSALTGARNATVGDALSWLDHYLRGADNGIADENPIVLRDVRTTSVHTYEKWPDGGRAIALGVPGSTKQTGSGIDRTWRANLTATGDSVATSGPYTTPFATYEPVGADLYGLTRSLSFVWTGPVVETPTGVNGSATLRVSLASDRARGTVVAYLYDLGTDGGKARLMSVQPYSFTGWEPGRARPVTITMQPISWTVPAGHRLAVVVDSGDPRYTELNTFGQTITASSTKASPATLTVPTGG